MSVGTFMQSFQKLNMEDKKENLVKLFAFQWRFEEM